MNCVARGPYDVDDLIDLLDSIESALDYNPYTFGVPHGENATNGCWVYSSPPIARIPKVYILYEIDESAQIVYLHASHFA